MVNALKELLNSKSNVKTLFAKSTTEIFVYDSRNWLRTVSFEFYFDITLSFCGFI